MTLIKSISGIRGTIGGKSGEGLSPLDIVKFTAAYASWAQSKNPGNKIKIVVGRDARISGAMLDKLVCGTLMGMGVDVVNIGLASTPTTELAVVWESAQGGLILTASHNPKQWNALKLLNNKGEFLNDSEGKRIIEIADSESFVFADVDNLGVIEERSCYQQKHIEHVCNLNLVDVDAIKQANFNVAIDCVNSVGGIILPPLLKALGVSKVTELYCDANGEFPHNPEPLPENLGEISNTIVNNKSHIGFVVDPDVDRLAIVNEDGTMFGEEYTLVAVADYVLSNTKGNTVSNLSSTRALGDVTKGYGANYYASSVGEVNVVTQMKQCDAVIGGEGNGGVIYPESHFGRDSLVGIGLFLTHLAKSKLKCSELRAKYPNYFMSKDKVQLNPNINVDNILEEVKKKYSQEKINDIDGIKIDFENSWVHLRKSNTEPIIRIYSEAPTEQECKDLTRMFIDQISDM